MWSVRYYADLNGATCYISNYLFERRDHSSDTSSSVSLLSSRYFWRKGLKSCRFQSWNQHYFPFEKNASLDLEYLREPVYSCEIQFSEAGLRVVVIKLGGWNLITFFGTQTATFLPYAVSIFEKSKNRSTFASLPHKIIPTVLFFYWMRVLNKTP